MRQYSQVPGIRIYIIQPTTGPNSAHFLGTMALVMSFCSTLSLWVGCTPAPLELWAEPCDLIWLINRRQSDAFNGSFKSPPVFWDIAMRRSVSLRLVQGSHKMGEGHVDETYPMHTQLRAEPPAAPSYSTNRRGSPGKSRSSPQLTLRFEKWMLIVECHWGLG